MTQNSRNEVDDGDDERSLSVSRRSLLRGLTATTATGGLAGCMGTMQRTYEATPAKVPEDTADEHNLEDLQVQKQEGKIKQNVMVSDIEADVTSYTTTYKETKEEEPAQQPTPTPTPTPTPSPTPSPTPTSASTPPGSPEDDDDEIETPQEAGTFSIHFPNQPIKQAENGQQYVTLNDVLVKEGGYIVLHKGGPDGPQLGTSDYIKPNVVVNTKIVLDDVSSLEEKQTHKLVAVPHTESNGGVGEPYPPSFWQDGVTPGQYTARVYFGGIEPVEPNTFSINSTPNPNFVGQDLNPLATRSVEELIQNNPKAFEQACNCTIDKPEEVQVRKADPSGIELSEDDIGRTVFHFDKEAMPSDVQKTTTFLGSEVPLEFFLVASAQPTSRPPGQEGTEQRDTRIRLDFVSAAKTTGQLRERTQEAVIASYVRRKLASVPTSEGDAGTYTALGTGAGDAGSYTATLSSKEGASKVADVCPSVTAGNTSTGTPTPTETPTPTPDLTQARDALARARDEFDGTIDRIREAEAPMSRELFEDITSEQRRIYTDLLRALDSVPEERLDELAMDSQQDTVALAREYDVPLRPSPEANPVLGSPGPPVLDPDRSIASQTISTPTPTATPTATPTSTPTPCNSLLQS